MLRDASPMLKSVTKASCTAGWRRDPDVEQRPRRARRCPRSRLGCTCRSTARWRVPSLRSSRRTRALPACVPSDAATPRLGRTRAPLRCRTEAGRSRPRPAGGAPGGRPSRRRFGATSGPTESSARVTVVISGLVGQRRRVVDAPSRISVLVSRTPEPSDRSQRGSRSSRSTSARRRAGSTEGSARRDAMSTARETDGPGIGRSSATGLPARVTVRRSPLSTRSITSPPWLRSSRIVTSAT